MPSLAQRVQRFEDEAEIRACVHRYMALCDGLDSATPLDQLLDCFTDDAVWQGVGERYALALGRHAGREAIAAMFRSYTGTPAHFALNVHFLTTERIELAGPDSAEGHWVMLQASTFADGRSHLNAARLKLGMARCADLRWRISCFETANLFSRPVDHWQDGVAIPVPGTHD